MPQAVIPFPMNTKSFVATILAVMVMMRLFLAALTFWWRRTNSPLKAEPMGGTGVGLSRFEKFCRLFLRREPRLPDDVEMGDVGVQGG